MIVYVCVKIGLFGLFGCFVVVCLVFVSFVQDAFGWLFLNCFGCCSGLFFTVVGFVPESFALCLT